MPRRMNCIHHLLYSICFGQYGMQQEESQMKHLYHVKNIIINIIVPTMMTSLNLSFFKKAFSFFINSLSVYQQYE